MMAKSDLLGILLTQGEHHARAYGIVTHFLNEAGLRGRLF